MQKLSDSSKFCHEILCGSMGKFFITYQNNKEKFKNRIILRLKGHSKDLLWSNILFDKYTYPPGEESLYLLETKYLIILR